MRTDPELIFKNNKAKRLSIPKVSPDGESAFGRSESGRPYSMTFRTEVSKKKGHTTPQLLGVFSASGLEICFKVKSKSIESVMTKLQAFGYGFKELP